MMRKLVAVSALLFAAGVCSAQTTPAEIPVPSNANSHPHSFVPGHYRFTFVVSDASAKPPRETLSFEVKVTPQKAGEGTFNISSKPTVAPPDAPPTDKIGVTCSNVHETEKGLEFTVSIGRDRVLDEVAPGTNEQIHRQINVNRKMQVALGVTQDVLPVDTRPDNKTQITVTVDTL